MTGHDLDHDDGMFEVPGSRLREMTDTIADLRAKLAAVEQERDEAQMRVRTALDMNAQNRERADRAEAALAAVQELHQPESYTRSVPTFDEFDLPIQCGTHCKSCRGWNWPCKTARALAAAEQPEPTPEQS